MLFSVCYIFVNRCLIVRCMHNCNRIFTRLPARLSLLKHQLSKLFQQFEGIHLLARRWHGKALINDCHLGSVSHPGHFIISLDGIRLASLQKAAAGPGKMCCGRRPLRMGNLFLHNALAWSGCSSSWCHDEIRFSTCRRKKFG